MANATTHSSLNEWIFLTVLQSSQLLAHIGKVFCNKPVIRTQSRTYMLLAYSSHQQLVLINTVSIALVRTRHLLYIVVVIVLKLIF
jgi:hypothetical protein